VAEGEERGDLSAVIVSVSDIDAFSIEDLLILTRPVVPCWSVLDSPGESCLSDVSLIDYCEQMDRA
jgi:hypothetical protein